ncbi:MAG: glycosyltransferase family 4 protein [Peptostreptococcaceae bacterium]
MKCLHVLPMNKLSGAEKLALILCKNMNTYEPIVVCGGDNLKFIFEKENIKSYSVDFANNNMLKTTKELKNIIKENDIKIIHAHDNNASVTSYITKQLYRLDVRVISHIHSCYPWLEGNTKNKKIDKFFRKRYDHNIACGKQVYDYYREYTDYIDEKNTTSISNAIDVEEINKYASYSTEVIYKEFNIPKDKTIFGFVGRLTEAKGIIPFIKNIGSYKAGFKNCKFLLVGNGEQEKEVIRLIKDFGLEDLFILTGHQDNVYKFYPLIDIFFLPSLYEGLPMVILEAMSFCKPIVSMNVGSIKEVITHNVNGVLVEKENYPEFIRSLITLSEDKELSNRYGREAYTEIDKNYNIEKYEKEINKIYNEIINK